MFYLEPIARIGHDGVLTGGRSGNRPPYSVVEAGVRPRFAAELNERGFDGVICLDADYSEEEAPDRLIVQDLAFARSLFEEEGGQQ